MSKSIRWVVGFHACQEAIKNSPKNIKEICFENLGEAEKPYWQDVLKLIRIKPQSRKNSFFSNLAEFGHQGVAVAVEGQPQWKENFADKSLLVFLDQVGDPHNLGAILRTSWLMNVDGIAVTERKSVKLTPAVCKVASGGAEHVPIEEFNFLTELKALKDQGYWTYAFSDKGTRSLYQMKFPEKAVFVFGSEEKGVRSSVLSECDELISIPQSSPGASYNISVSVGIALAEFNRQVRWSDEKN